MILTWTTSSQKEKNPSRQRTQYRQSGRGEGERNPTKVWMSLGNLRTDNLVTIINFQSRKPFKNMQNSHNMSFVYLPPQFPYFALFSVSQGFSEASSPQTDQVYSPNGGFIMPSPESFYSPKHFIPSLPYSGLPTLMKEELQPIDLSQHNSLNCDSPRKPLASLPTDQSLQDKNKSLLKLQEQSLAAPLLKQKGDYRGSKGLDNGNHDEYLPQMDRQRKSILRYQVNQNRNVVPNEINQIFSFVQKQNKSGHLLAKIMKKYPPPLENCSMKRFYLYQGLLKNRLGHYSNEKSLKVVNELYEPRCENWSEQEQRYYNKLCRVLIHHFLREDSIFIILTSKRMKKEKKRDHLLARRQIREAVTNVLRGF